MAHDHSAHQTVTAIDPVCGMTVDPARAAGSFEYDGQTYYFCNRDVSGVFRRTRRNSSSPASPNCRSSRRPGVTYTCPMHPEVRARHAGRLPDLRHGARAAHDHGRRAPNPELVDMTRRFWIAAALACRSSLLAMGDMVLGPGLGHRTRRPRSPTGSACSLARRSCSGRAGRFFSRGLGVDRHRHPNMFTLIALGVGAAFVFSVGGDARARRCFPRAFRCTARWPPTSTPRSVIVVLVLLGQVLELRARGRTSSALRQLLGLAPKTARRGTRRPGARRAARGGARRRRAARAARREGPGRRRRHRGQQRRRRVDGDGEPMPVRRSRAAGSPARPSTAPARF